MKRINFLIGLVLILLLIVPSLSFAQDAASTSIVLGEVYYKQDVDSEYDRIRAGSQLAMGSFILTGEEGKVEISFPGGSLIRLSEDTEIELQVISEDTIEIFVLAGEIFSKIESLTGTQTFNVSGPSMSAGVRGTQFLFKSDGLVAVLEGVVAVTNPQYPDIVVDVPAGSQIVVFPDQPAAIDNMQPLSDADKSVIEAEQEEFETEDTDIEDDDDTENNENDQDNEEDEIDEDDVDEDDEAEEDTSIDYIEVPDVEELEPEPRDIPEDEGGGFELPFGLDFLLGPLSLEDDGGYSIYTQTTMIMEFNFGPLGLGVIVPIFFDSTSPFNASTWANSEEWQFDSFQHAVYSIISKIMYVTYGKKYSDPIWFKVGTIDDMTFSTGFLVERYSNALTFPQKREIGFLIGIDTGVFGMEFMLSNLSNFSIIGFRPYVKPLDPLPLSIGLSFVMDLDPLSSNSSDPNQLLFVSADNFKIFYFSLNSEFPIIAADISPVTLIAYADLAKSFYQGEDPDTGTVKDFGTAFAELVDFTKPWGLAIGVRGKIIYVIDYRLEYLNLQNGFVPRYFDRFYDIERSDPDKYQQMTNPTTQAFNGIRGAAGFTWDINNTYEDASYIKADFTALIEDVTKNYLYFALYLEQGLIPKFYGILEYHRKDIVSFEGFFSEFLNEDTILHAEITYLFDPMFGLSIFFTRTFIRTDTGEMLPSDTFGFETKFSF